MSNIPALEHFIVHKSSATCNLDKSWELYTDEFELFIRASGITDEQQKVALLLHLGERDLRKIYNTMKEENENYTAVKTKLKNYFKPKQNTTYNRYIFKNLTQEESESFLSYITRLRTAAENCQFHDVEAEIRDHFIFTCRSKSLKKKLLQEENLTLARLIDHCKNKEVVEKQVEDISTRNTAAADEIANRIEKVKINKEPKYNRNPDIRRKGNNNKCFKCGNIFVPNHLQTCPAIGKKCYNCRKANHLSKVCRAKKFDK